VGLPPNQLYMWAQEGAPMLTYFAAPAKDASNLVYHIADRVLESGSSFFATNDRIAFEKAQDFNGLQWRGAPFISPFLKSTNIHGGDFLFGGVSQPSDTNSPPPPELFQQVLGSTNLVCYDWEITGPRSDQVHYLAQFLRFVSLKDQMWSYFVSRAWLKAISLNLGNCGTVVTLTAPDQISFVRKSTLGFTSPELNLLADWFESPDFPFGLRSFVPAAPDAPIPPTGRLGTNNPASSSLPQK